MEIVQAEAAVIIVLLMWACLILNSVLQQHARKAKVDTPKAPPPMAIPPVVVPPVHEDIVEIVRCSGQQMEIVGYRAEGHPDIQEALNTPGLAIRRNGLVDPGKQ